MHFKLDENLSDTLTRLFVEAGHDAVTVVEQGMAGEGDAGVAAVCAAENRVLVTLDTDFADIRVYPPEHYPGLVVLRLSRQGPRHQVEVVSRFLRQLHGPSLQGQLWIVEDARVRIRE